MAQADEPKTIDTRHLPLILAVAKFLDPRKWRKRLKQFGIALGVLTYLALRAVRLGPAIAQRRDLRHAGREQLLRNKVRAREKEIALETPPPDAGTP